jgi:hypothetical protein
MMPEEKPEQKPEQSDSNYASVDDEVADWLAWGVSLLCDAADRDVNIKLERQPGRDRSVLFLADLATPRFRAMLIGKRRLHIRAFQEILKGMGGAYGRFYSLALVDENPPAGGLTQPPATSVSDAKVT